MRPIVLLPVLMLAACAESAPSAAPTEPSIVQQESAFCAAAADWSESPAFYRLLATAESGDKAAARRAMLDTGDGIRAMYEALPSDAPEPTRTALKMMAAVTNPGMRRDAPTLTPDERALREAADPTHVMRYISSVCYGV
jgi:hypothetical protein